MGQVEPEEDFSPPLVGSTLCVKSRGGKYAATVKDVIEEVRVECCIIHWHIVNFDIYRQILQTTRGSWYVRYIIICVWPQYMVIQTNVNNGPATKKKRVQKAAQIQKHYFSIVSFVSTTFMLSMYK